MQTNKKFKVLVTGFSKDSCNKNYSWRAAENLVNEKEKMKWPDNVQIDIKDLTYSYKSVKTQIDYLFTSFRPHLIIHLNYDLANRYMKIEQCSFNKSYRLNDNFGYSPPNQCAIENGFGRLETDLDLGRLCKKGEEYCNYKNIGTKLKCEISKYPGESLAAYLYYLSLNQDLSKNLPNSCKSLLINIPAESVYSAKEINYTLKGIILEALNQLQK